MATNSGIMHMFPWFKRTPVVSQQSVDNIDRTLSTDEKIERLADRLGANNRPANDLASRDLVGRFTQTRVIAVCDAFHAMTEDRIYRAALTLPAAVSEIERCSGTQFDPTCVRALLEVVRAEGWADAEREHVVQPPDAEA